MSTSFGKTVTYAPYTRKLLETLMFLITVSFDLEPWQSNHIQAVANRVLAVTFSGTSNLNAIVTLSSY